MRCTTPLLTIAKHNIMRTETITKQYLKFEELNDEQKSKAISDNYDINTDYEWHDCAIEDAKEIGNLMGFDIDDIYFSGFSSQGDGACFNSSFSHVKGILANVKDYAPLDTTLHAIAKDIQDLHRKAFYTVCGSTVQYGHYSHEYSMRIGLEEEKGECDYEEWKEVLADFARWIYSNLESQYNFLTSNEAIAESLISNEVEFDIECLS